MHRNPRTNRALTALAPLAALSLGVAACDRAATTAPGGAPSAAVHAAASAGPSANGSGRITFGPNQEHVSFNARLLADGTARGQAEFQDPTAGVNGHIEINCLNVVGNTATLSGIVTRSSDPTIVGFEALFQVQDNGEGAKAPPDQMSLVLLHAVGVGPNCQVPSEFDLVPVESGNVQVNP